MKKKLIPILIVVVVAGAAFYAYKEWFGRKPDNRIMVSGNIELNEVNIAFKTAGRLIERDVDEGDPVKAGQVVARLDRDVLRFPPDLVIICYGDGDREALRQIVEKVRATGKADVLLRAPNPVVVPNMPAIPAAPPIGRSSDPQGCNVSLHSPQC